MGSKKKNVIVNDLYLQWVLQPSYETIAVCGVLILAIVLFSVVVIYNIFQVGIVNKIQEYGLRKFTFGNNGVESTHDVLTKYQTMTCGFNIPLFCT